MPHTLKHLDSWPVALLFCLSILLLRAWFFVAWEESYFNSDQAIVGLMAKRIFAVLELERNKR